MYTYKDITAPPPTIWSNVVRVRTISEEEDRGYLTRFMGFPRPIRAELNYAGVGGGDHAGYSEQYFAGDPNKMPAEIVI